MEIDADGRPPGRLFRIPPRRRRSIIPAPRKVRAQGLAPLLRAVPPGRRYRALRPQLAGPGRLDQGPVALAAIAGR